MKTKIIFNVGNIIKGGAIQAAVNFITINQKMEDDFFDWFFVLSQEVYDELTKSKITIENNVMITSGKISKNKLARQEVLSFEKRIAPLIVFTLFGPCYIKFKAIHISGFANGWITHSTIKTFINTYHYNLFKITKALLKYTYYSFHIKQADAWIFETETAQNGFINRLRVDKKSCFVVANTAIDFGKCFSKKNSEKVNQQTLFYVDNLIVSLAANYSHKNLLSLLLVAKYLKYKLKNEKFKLVLTLDEKVFADDFLPFIIDNELQNNIINIGKVNIVDLPKLYSVTYATILPSFIETFSAIYPESFATKTPIITTDAEFSHEICQKAAIYIDPKNTKNMAHAINLLITNTKKYDELLVEGKVQHLKMLTADQKYQKYIGILSRYVS